MKKLPCLAVLLVIFFGGLRVGAQGPTPGPNTNMVSGNTWPTGDPFLQRQNEPSIAASTRNPLHLLAGANDYRTVDIPGLPEGRVTGDAWLGVFKSYDGGLTWRSTLLPGYPQDTSSPASPLKGYQAGADPTVRAGTNGMFFYSGIAFDRTVATTSRVKKDSTGRTARKNGSKQYTAADPFGASAVFVARFIDNNNRAGGDVVQYIDTRVVKNNPGTFFIDKPWLATDIPRPGASTCRIPGTAATPAQSFAAGRLYLAFAEVEGTGPTTRSRIMFSRSLDCGVSWSEAREISIGHRINQGATIAVDHVTGDVYVAWRRFQTAAGTDGPAQPNAIQIVKSTDGGRTFSTPMKVRDITPFDQGTSAISMRSSGYPTLTIDTLGRPYVAWSQRGIHYSGDARVVVAMSDGRVSRNGADDDDLDTARNDVMSWSEPVPVHNHDGRGHQIMPSMSFAAGRLAVIYYNLVEDHTRGLFTRDPLTGELIEARDPVGNLAPAPGDPDKVFSPFIAEAVYVPGSNPPAFTGGLVRRHTVDVWVAQAKQSSFPAFTARRLSNYRIGSRPGSFDVEQLQYNPPLLPLFACGTSGVAADCRPFMGDYIDLSPSPAFRTDPLGIWIPNFLPFDTTVFHAAWTDNRDVRPPADGNWANYQPPVSAFSGPPGQKSLFDPTQNRPTCSPTGNTGLTNAGMRNQNIYTARVTQGLYLSALDNSKQLGGIQRAFSVNVQNGTVGTKSYRLTIRAERGVVASFLQFSTLTSLDVNIAPRSSISRTVFVQSSDRRARVTVDVNEINAAGGTLVSGGLSGDLVLNPDITNPDITNPDITNPDITNAEVYNPDITNPDITNPDITNPDITNPDITNPDITNPDITNPDITNPDITNPDITNPDITNPDITNPDITNPDITNGTVTDTTWSVTNTGNTSASYNVKLLLNGQVPQGFILQLILHRVYKTPIVIECDLGEQSHNVLIANIRNPQFVTDPAELATPDITNPDITNATLGLAPGQTGRITLRVVDRDRNDGVTFNAATSVSPVVIAQAVNTLDVAAGRTDPPFTVPALVIVAATLADGVVGAAYPGARLESLGGFPPKSWSLAGESQLPPGLTLAPDGTISGTPTTAGTYSFTARVTDSSTPQQTATGNFTIKVVRPLVFNAPAPPDAIVGDDSYSYTLTASDGTPAYSWTLVSGALPAGLTLGSGGTITGTATAAGTSTAQVKVTDAGSPAQSVTREVVIRAVAPLQVATATLPNGFHGVVYSADVAAAGGVEPYAWKQTGGALPPGLNFNSVNGVGQIRGTPTAPGAYSFTLAVFDDTNPSQQAERTFAIVIAPRADLAISLADSADPVPSNRRLTYVATVTNHGPSAASGVVLRDVLSAGTTYVSATPTQGSCLRGEDGTVSCSLGMIASGGSARVAIEVNAEVGSVSNTANVQGPDDPNADNNTATETTEVTNQNQLLFYGPSLNAAEPNEASLAAGAGYGVRVVDAATWEAMSAAEFRSYSALVFPDPHCAETPAPLAIAEKTRGTWSAAVTGPKVVIGTDLRWHHTVGEDPASEVLTLNSLLFASSGASTGMSMSLSCYYFEQPEPVAVTVLSVFGEFLVQGAQVETVEIDQPEHQLMQGLTNQTLSNWSTSVHEWFTQVPAGWSSIASGVRVLPDSRVKRPYIVAKP